jgi:hypothetical protein
VAEELSDLLRGIHARYAELPAGSNARRDFLAHLQSLARWHAEPNDYPKVSAVEFPTEVLVAFAICHPECGAREFIVDGSTQECQSCGGLLFRTETREYRLAR